MLMTAFSRTTIAADDTAEGRANNRRVEIIVQKKLGQ
jgi:flagellar motor protein MotB